MPDFAQRGPISTLHDLGTVPDGELEERLCESAAATPIGVVIPVTADDMRAPPFARIVDELTRAEFVDTAVVVLNDAPSIEDYRHALRLLIPLGRRGQVLWTDGPRGQAVQSDLDEAGFAGRRGKGRAVWIGFGYLLADPGCAAFVVHDGDIVDYDRHLLVRLCLPMTHPAFDYDFVKAYYARATDRMYGRVARLLLSPLLAALRSVFGEEPFLVFVESFRYPLAGELAITAGLARANRVPGHWGLEIGTLAEVFRNTSAKRCCQVDLGRSYDHKHQPLSLTDHDRGLMRMAGDIVTTLYRTLASRSVVIDEPHLVTIRTAYLRAAQDAIRSYSADAMLNGLAYDRHAEEEAVEGFAEIIARSGERFAADPVGEAAMPTWTRVLSALPHLPERLRAVAAEDAAGHG